MRISRGNLVLFTSILAVVALTGSAIASHQFQDVPDGGFHDDIAYVNDRGIAFGFNDGTYRPGEPVTRGQMAAFIHRSSGNKAGTAPSVRAADLVCARCIQSSEIYPSISWIDTSPDTSLYVQNNRDSVAVVAVQGVSGYKGVVGNSNNWNDGVGVEGLSHNGGPGAIGVWGRATGTTGYAGFFSGNVGIQGTLAKSAGTFKIDHPLDPANKYLSHSFVESPDMMNVYNGNVVLNDRGRAVVRLPEWFEALNRDYRYQLTPIGAFAKLFIAREVHDNRFTIAGGKPGLEVSWQVTGIRQDPYARDNPIVVEEDKPAAERGTYLYPQGYGQPPSKGIFFDRIRARTASRGGPATR